MIFENQFFSHNHDKIWYTADLLKKYDKSWFYANFLENRENRGDFHDMGRIDTGELAHSKRVIKVKWPLWHINLLIIIWQSQ